jgi:membrane-associated protein
VFSETGLIIFAVLPGDSLIFAAGSLVAMDVLDPLVVFILMPVAAFAGDQVNYLLGHVIGNRMIRRGNLPFVNKENLDKTQRFFKQHGAKTIIYGRYIPVIRSFAPFVAASGNHMSYGRFLKFSAIGSVSWALIFLMIGFFLGEIPFVKDNFYFVTIGIALLTLIPVAIQILIERRSVN